MTSEILVMNKEAIALASDSAATLTGEKIFNANKIFRLSQSEPVGIMIYNNSEYLGIPWETVIKEYRKEKGEIVRSYLIEYADDFINYLNTLCSKYQDIERNYHRKELQICAQKICSEIREHILYEVQKISQAKQDIELSEVEEIIKDITKQCTDSVVQTPFPPDFNSEDEDKFSLEYTSIIQDEIVKYLEKLPYNSSIADITHFIVKLYLKQKLTNISSGIIIAGFGDSELFPSYSLVDYFTRVNGRQFFIRNQNENKGKITQDSPSIVSAFADNSQIKSFMDGIAPDIDQAVIEMFDGFIEEYNIHLKTVFRSDSIMDIIKKQEFLKSKYLNMFKQKKYYLHSLPIVHIVAHLPKSELAEMAESLVHLSSLRKRVSTESETIGGPIDVVIISKGDGFIWIKRKHYFKPELNLHYSTR